MKVKRLKEILGGFDDETEIFVRNSFNICGNISRMAQVEQATYGFFGVNIPCLIINSENSAEIAVDVDDYYIDLINSTNSTTSE